MPEYMTNREVRYGGKTYKSGDIIPVSTKDVRLLVAIGHIREAPREDRVVASLEAEPAPVPTSPVTAAQDHVVERSVDPVNDPANPAQVAHSMPHESELDTVMENATLLHEDNFEVEEVPMPEELKEEESTPTKRTYRSRRLKSDDE